MAQQPKEDGQFSVGNVDLLLWMAQIGSECVRVIINPRRGTTVQGMSTFIAFLAIPTIASLVRSPGLILYWYVFTFFVVYRRIFADREADTNYVGRPFLPRLLTLGLLGHDAARQLEPFVVFAISYLFTGPVSFLVAFGGICMLFENAIWKVIATKERNAIHNARLRAQRYGNW